MFYSFESRDYARLKSIEFGGMSDLNDLSLMIMSDSKNLDSIIISNASHLDLTCLLSFYVC